MPLGHGHEVRPAGQLAHQHAALVAHRLRLDVLVGGRIPGDAADVHAALVREGALADERLVRAEVHVQDLVDEPRQLREVLDPAGDQQLVALLLQRQVGDHGDQIDVAAALAKAVDRALDLHGPGVDGGQRIGHRQLAVIVAMDAHRHGDRLDHVPHGPGNVLRHRAAVGVAEHDHPRPGLGRRPQGGNRVRGVGLPAVEEVFGVENHLAAVGRQVGDALADHRQVLVGVGAEDLGHLEERALADDGDRLGAGVEQGPQALVFRGLHALAAGHAEGADPHVLQRQFADPLEVLRSPFHSRPGSRPRHSRTPRLSSRSVMASLSCNEKLMPSACEPSRRVVS